MLLLCLSASLEAVGLRVVSYNVGAHFTDRGYPDYSLGDVGTLDFTSVRDVLARIDADVVALQEIHSADVAGNPDDLDALAAALGLPHIYIASTSGSFDTSLRVVFLSRYPFILTDDIRSPSGAKEITRHFPVIKVDVPGTTNDPLVISGHLKSGTGLDDRFRRAVEMKRLVKYLDDEGVQASDNFIILGDFNPSGVNVTFNSLPTGLPSTFSVGSDIGFPVRYSTNMLSYFSGLVPTRLDPRQMNGDDGTFQFGQTLDLVLVSPALAGRPHASEIYRSNLDTSNTSGLAKAGSPLANNASSDASDHYAVFADFELDQDFSDLGLAISAPSVIEGDDSGTVQLTVSLPMPAASAVNVDFSSDDPAAAFPLDAGLTIPAGQSIASTGVQTSRNYLVDGIRTVTFTASASGYDAAAVMINVIDADGAYVFNTAGETVEEDFDGFGGNHDPAPWVSNAGAWMGVDDGSSGLAGGRSYGASGDDSFGYLPDSQVLVASASFQNQSDTPLTILDIAFTAEQWRAAFGGSADKITVELEAGGITTPLGPLAFDARTDLPTGPSTYSETKSLRVSGLSVPPGGELSLRFTFAPGPGSGVLPADVFVNELHYSNASTDEGEFVEVVVGPGFSGALADIDLILYNGANGLMDGSPHSLDSFVLGTTTSSGHRIYSKLIPGIQNGSPDGLALVVDGVVASFLSYEGSFVGSEGPALGLTSTNIGVTQSDNEPVGKNALGLSGSGGVSADFAWTKFTGIDHSPGAPNSGQTFSIPGLPPQGLAIDNLMMTFVPDSDGDGVGDDEDGDDDNDGQSDDFELAFGSDPLNAASVFKTILGTASGSYGLSFPGGEGILYTVEWCDDLIGWETLTTHLGEGAEINVPLPSGEARAFFRVRVGG